MNVSLHCNGALGVEAPGRDHRSGDCQAAMAGTSPPTWRLSREDEETHQACSYLVGARLITVEPEAVILHCPRLRPGPAGGPVGRVQRRELALRCVLPGDAVPAGHSTQRCTEMDSG